MHTSRVAVTVVIVSACALATSCTKSPDAAKETRETARKSVGRGWPVPVPLHTFDGYPEDDFVGSVTPWYYQVSATATGGKAPEGVEPLPRDLFTSKDFYADRDLWMDKR
jgi:hypothetical protein